MDYLGYVKSISQKIYNIKRKYGIKLGLNVKGNTMHTAEEINNAIEILQKDGKSNQEILELCKVSATTLRKWKKSGTQSDNVQYLFDALKEIEEKALKVVTIANVLIEVYKNGGVSPSRYLLSKSQLLQIFATSGSTVNIFKTIFNKPQMYENVRDEMYTKGYWLIEDISNNIPEYLIVSRAQLYNYVANKRSFTNEEIEYLSGYSEKKQLKVKTVKDS